MERAGDDVGDARDRRRFELAHFLRARRERLTPAQVGIATRRSRRTPGLRREEVAFLADIGVKWYARLESGDDVKPSVATLSGIAKALLLTPAETGYVFDLAGLSEPKAEPAAAALAIPAIFDVQFPSTRGAAVMLSDAFFTPFRWNAVADGMFELSRYPIPLERNLIVRGLFDPDFIDFFGGAYDELARNAIGIFRQAYMSAQPSLLARQVFEKIKDAPLFQRFWEERVVADQVTTPHELVRHHAHVGTFKAYGLDLLVPHRNDLRVRILYPSDEASAQKFARLEGLGTPWSA